MTSEGQTKRWIATTIMIVCTMILVWHTFWFDDKNEHVKSEVEPEAIFLDSFRTSLRVSLQPKASKTDVFLMVINEHPCPGCLVELQEYARITDSLGITPLIHLNYKDSTSGNRLLKIANFTSPVSAGYRISDGTFESVPEKIDTLSYIGLMYRSDLSMVTGIVQLPYNLITPIGYKLSVIRKLRGQ